MNYCDTMNAFSRYEITARFFGYMRIWTTVSWVTVPRRLSLSALVAFYVLQNFGTLEIDAAVDFVEGKTPFHPIGEGDEGDAQVLRYFFTADKEVGLFVGRRTFGRDIFQAFFKGVLDPLTEVVLSRNK